jgi:acyl-CoA thioesterase-1
MRRTLIAGLSLMVLLSAALAPARGFQEPAKEKAKKPDPRLATIVDDPRLPRVLLIGDSISMGYTLPVRKLLEGKANVHRIPVNGGPTTRGLENIDAWLGNGKWDVIHFNFGIHDMVRLDPKGNTSKDATGTHRVPLDQYERNLERLVERMKQTGATLIFATTTPIPPGVSNVAHDDAVPYNEAALRVMKKHGVRVDDLHAAILPALDEAQLPKNVHFKAEGSERLAREVARSIAEALPRD